MNRRAFLTRATVAAIGLFALDPDQLLWVLSGFAEITHRHYGNCWDNQKATWSNLGWLPEEEKYLIDYYRDNCLQSGLLCWGKGDELYKHFSYRGSSRYAIAMRVSVLRHRGLIRKVDQPNRKR